MTNFVEQIPGIPLEMVAIPAGTFLMGSPKNEAGRYHDEPLQHRVRVRGFFMGQYPVTQAQWRAVAGLPMDNRALDPDPSRFKGDDRPVDQVNWYDAVEFCDRLSQYTGKTYRLPSGAEWEYACRAGTTTPYSFGKNIRIDQSNFKIDQSNFKADGTTQVGRYPANGRGLHDMHGNVWEWCQDAHGGGDWAQYRLLRGGSWFFNAQFCRSAFHKHSNPAYRIDDIGFRVAVSIAGTNR